MDQWLVIDVDCAECRGAGLPALVRILKLCPDEAEARSYAETHWQNRREWERHPQGGYIIATGQGDLWIVPLSAFQNPRLLTDDEWYSPTDTTSR